MSVVLVSGAQGFGISLDFTESPAFLAICCLWRKITVLFSIDQAAVSLVDIIIPSYFCNLKSQTQFSGPMEEQDMLYLLMFLFKTTDIS